ncbi:MAG: metal-dependent hydrolase, partial [Spirochaetota bacterium]
MLVRDIHFEFEPALIFNYTRNPRLTRYLNSLSLLFPAGEKFFIRSVRKFESQVPQMQDDIQMFCQQEGRHSREHIKVNKILQSHGVEVSKIEDETAKRLYRLSKGDPAQELLVTIA